MSKATPHWMTRSGERKQKQIDSLPEEWIIECPPESQLNVMTVPKTCGLLNSRELDITECNVELLLPKLASGEYSSVEVTLAFYKRAIIAHQLTNCLTEIFVERALERAAILDSHLHEHGPVGPLHGLPISLKVRRGIPNPPDCCSRPVRIQGPIFNERIGDNYGYAFNTSHGNDGQLAVGYVGWIGDYSNEDCTLVELLYACGANPFVRTNVPQTLIWGETYNHVFGRTVNPHNRLCTPGGSSGGEGALLALRGSPLGVGTDIGGSVRIPSAFCGLYALRPSYERLPYHGAKNSAEGQESVLSVLGPMANSIGAIKVFTKAILDSNPWDHDPLCIRKPWDVRAYELNDHGRGRKMCFAMMWDNEVVMPHPPVTRAMGIVKTALEAAGHKVIAWKNHKHMELFHVVEYIWAADASEDYQRHCDLSGEPLIQIEGFTTEETKHLYSMETPPLNKIVAEGRGEQSAHQLWQLHKLKRQLRKEYLDAWIATNSDTGTGRPVDGIISPTMPYGMTPHGLNTDAFYTTLFNALDYPAVSFPVTTVDPVADKELPPRTHFYNHEDEAIYRLYDTELFQDSPIGLQLVGRTQEEEATIAMVEIIVGALRRQQLSNQG